MTMNAKYPGTCRSCGAKIRRGQTISYTRATGAIGCATTSDAPSYGGRRPRGYYASIADPNGLYTPDGRCIGRLSCGHEDYPCCGC